MKLKPSFEICKKKTKKTWTDHYFHGGYAHCDNFFPCNDIKTFRQKNWKKSKESHKQNCYISTMIQSPPHEEHKKMAMVTTRKFWLSSRSLDA